MTPTQGAAPLATDRVFTYGTLMAGFSRRPLLGAAVLEGRGRIPGTLYDFGEYPGVVPDAGGWVAGELYRVPDLAARLPTLDREEWCDPADETRSLYLRRLVSVRLDHGTIRDAWVYVYNPLVGGPPERGPRIESGDWRAHLEARAAVPR